MQEQEIIALINSKGAFILENSKVNAELIAYVDCKNDELFETSAKIEWEVSDKISLEDIKRFKMYHLKVKDLGENTFLLIDIVKKDVKNIVYVSCNANTLARDYNIFKENGYILKEISCVDMFPNTIHTETVVLMSKVVPVK